MPRAASRQSATSAAPRGPSVPRSFWRPARMRVLAVPSGRPSSAATCSCVRSSRKARPRASRWGGGSESSADWRTARRCCCHAVSAGPGSPAGKPASRSPSGSGTISGWRLRRRSSFRRRKCAICRIHARTVPRSGSNRPALRHTTRKTSCTRSSAAARADVWTAKRKISRAKRRWSRPSASAEPSATWRISSSSRGAFCVDGIRRFPFVEAYIGAAWWCEGAPAYTRRPSAPPLRATTPGEGDLDWSSDETGGTALEPALTRQRASPARVPGRSMRRIMSAFTHPRRLACRRLVRRGAPVGHGEAPPAPERAVEGDDGHELVPLRAREVELGGKELLLGLEDFEVARDAVVVALERQRDRRLERLHRLVALGVHALELLLGDERVRHLRERAERCLLVAFDGFVPPGRARPIAREKPSTLEERTRERAADGPHVAGALHHVLELAALAPVQAGEAEAREEARHGDADVGVRRHERLLGLLDVGAPLEELGRQAGGHLWRRRLAIERRAARDLAGRPSEQGGELVLLDDDLALELRDARAGLGERRLRARHLEQRADSTHIAPLEEVDGVLERDPRALRDLELAVELEQLEVRLRHVAHQGEEHATPHRLGGEIVGARGLRSAPDAAPDVDLPGEVEGPEEGVEGQVRRDAGHRGALADRLALIAHLRKHVGACDGDLVVGLLDARRRRPQVVAAADRLLDERLQGGVAENRPPRRVRKGGGIRRAVLATRRLGRGDDRAPVARPERAGREDRHRNDREPRAAAATPPRATHAQALQPSPPPGPAPRARTPARARRPARPPSAGEAHRTRASRRGRRA